MLHRYNTHQVCAEDATKPDFFPLLLVTVPLERDLGVAGLGEGGGQVAEGELGHGADQGGGQGACAQHALASGVVRHRATANIKGKITGHLVLTNSLFCNE